MQKAARRKPQGGSILTLKVSGHLEYSLIFRKAFTSGLTPSLQGRSILMLGVWPLGILFDFSKSFYQWPDTFASREKHIDARCLATWNTLWFFEKLLPVAWHLHPL